MKLLSNVLQACFAVVIFLWVFQLRSHAQLDPQKLEKVEELVISGLLRNDPILQRMYKIGPKGPDDEMTDERMRKYETLRAQYLDRVRQRIRTEPGLKPYIFQLIDRSYEELKRPIDLDRALDALALRDDLKPNDIAPIRREIAKILADPEPRFSSNPRRRGMQEQYLASGMAVLARDMTPESEDLALQAMQWERDQINVGASRALAKNGVARAIPEVEKFVKRLTDEKHPWAEGMRKTLEELKRNAAQKSPPTPSLPTPAPTRPGKKSPELGFFTPVTPSFPNCGVWERHIPAGHSVARRGRMAGMRSRYRIGEPERAHFARCGPPGNLRLAVSLRSLSPRPSSTGGPSSPPGVRRHSAQLLRLLPGAQGAKTPRLGDHGQPLPARPTTGFPSPPATSTIVTVPDFSAVLADLKKFTARRLLAQLAREGRDWLLDQLATERTRHKTRSRHQVWQEGFHPQAIHDDAMLLQKLDCRRRPETTARCHGDFSTCSKLFAEKASLRSEV